MNRRVFLCLVTLIALVATACGSDSSGPNAQGLSPDGEWVLTSLVIEGDMAIALPDRPLELRISGSEIGGDAGCNSMGGSATFAGDGAVEILELFWAEMACAEPSVMDFEQQYTQAFLAVTSWSTDGEQLTLSGDGVEATYTPRIAPPDLPLVGTVWTLDTFFDGEAAMNAAGMDEVRVVFSETGVNVSGRCWTIPGFATIEPGGEGNLSLDFSSADPGFTCEDRSFFDEMVERLSATSEYRIIESRLTLGTSGEDRLSLRG